MKASALVLALLAPLSGVPADAPLPLVPAPRLLVRRPGTAGASNVFERTDAALPREGYRLTVDSHGAAIEAADGAGAFYARQTLAQLPVPWPCLEISDSPAYRWRGLHLDESRHFFGKETVKALLDRMAERKLNVFHWHLTDDQGWRIDVPGYPDLIRYGAVRSASPRRGTHPSRGTVQENAAALDGTRYGPFWYSEADLREIVAYAAARHITIVPEVELPGHVYAALAAYPEFACFPENLAGRDPRTIWGIEKDVLCVGNPRAVSFMEDVLDYVCRVFPGPYVHIGGDECPTTRWEACEKCRAFRAAHGIVCAARQQAWTTRHFAQFLAARGKRAVGWDECLSGDVPSDVVGMSWRDPGCAGAGQEIVAPADALARGHEMVMSPNSYCYLDYGQGLQDDPCQYARRTLTLERAYLFDPCEGIPESLRGGVLGGQGNNWTEYTWNGSDLAWKVWPRAAALAECLWLGAERPGFDDFKRRLAAQSRSSVGIAPGRIGVCSWSFRLPLAAVADDMRRMDVNVVQLALEPIISPAEGGEAGAARALAFVKEQIAARRWRVASTMVAAACEDYSTLESIRRTGGIVPDALWAENRRRFSEGARLTAELGARYLSFHAGFIDETDKAAYAACRGRVAWIRDEAARHGVEILLETGQETAEELSRFLARVPGVGVNFDPANMVLYGKGRPVDAVRTLFPYIRQIHVKDAVASPISGEWGRETVWGGGDVRAAEFVAVLESMGYTGDYIIERESGDARFADIRRARDVLAGARR